MISRFLIILTAILISYSCSREEVQDTVEPFRFESLTAENNTLKPGETTKIKAAAIGSNLVYKWTATAGDILGSGQEVIYAASICHIGTNYVTCEVSSGNNQPIKRTVEIVVLDE